MAIADKIRDSHEVAVAAQQAQRNGRRVIRRIVSDDEAPIAIDKVPIVIEQPMPAAVPHSAITLSPLDLPTEAFSTGLNRRKQNRKVLLDWLRTALVDGVDYGRIHVASKERCQFAKQGRIKECTDPYHWSKPSLFKPGAEKISGMLGVTVHFPSLPDYEKAVLSQTEIKMILIRCELRDAQGRVVAEGVGARNLTQDYGDINKSLKMVEKSAHIDATLRLAGLSEVFTQDVEDMAMAVEDVPEPEPPPKQSLHRDSKKAATNATSATPSNADETISREELATLRQQISKFGFTEQRVLAWLSKTSEGTVSKLDQLTGKQCTSLLKRLDSWAEAEKSLVNGQKGKGHE